MAAGVPVVATAVGGNVDAVADGITGYLVAPGRASEMAQALRRLVNSDLLRAAFGVASRERAALMYRAAPTMLALQSMYDTLLQRAAP
jgi:glycosyltransferase involved in cell wall biosynthesis